MIRSCWPVQMEMYSEGEIVRMGDLLDPTSGSLSLLLRKVGRNLMRIRPTSTPSLQALSQDHLVLTTLLKVYIHL